MSKWRIFVIKMTDFLSVWCPFQSPTEYLSVQRRLKIFNTTHNEVFSNPLWPHYYFLLERQIFIIYPSSSLTKKLITLDTVGISSQFFCMIFGHFYLHRDVSIFSILLQQPVENQVYKCFLTLTPPCDQNSKKISTTRWRSLFNDQNKL